jgi:hypothetical protein
VIDPTITKQGRLKAIKYMQQWPPTDVAILNRGALIDACTILEMVNKIVNWPKHQRPVHFMIVFLPNYKQARRQSMFNPKLSAN